MSSADPIPRGPAARRLRVGMLAALTLLLGTLAVDAWQRSAPPLILVFWFLPIVVLLPGIARDRLRTVTWLSFVSLLYFLLAVLRIFAEPGSPRAQLELLAVIVLFNCSMFYIRQRGKELSASATSSSLAEAE